MESLSNLKLTFLTTWESIKTNFNLTFTSYPGVGKIQIGLFGKGIYQNNKITIIDGSIQNKTAIRTRKCI